MDYDNPVACSQGAQSVFYNACRVCGTMNINYAVDGIGTLDNPILKFKCRGCGRDYKMYAYIKENGVFQGYRNKHARTSIVRYENVDQLGIVIDKETVALLTLKPLPVYVPTSEVQMVENMRKYTGYHPPEVISECQTMFDYGLYISWAKCPKCSETLLANEVKKVMSPLCVEVFSCKKCKTKIRRRRYYSLKEGFGWGYPVAVRSLKSKVLYFGITFANGYLLQVDGATRQVPSKYVELVKQRD